MFGDQGSENNGLGMKRGLREEGVEGLECGDRKESWLPTVHTGDELGEHALRRVKAKGFSKTTCMIDKIECTDAFEKYY